MRYPGDILAILCFKGVYDVEDDASNRYQARCRRAKSAIAQVLKVMHSYGGGSLISTLASQMSSPHLVEAWRSCPGVDISIRVRSVATRKSNYHTKFDSWTQMKSDHNKPTASCDLTLQNLIFDFCLWRCLLLEPTTIANTFLPT
jgi:hypothetical protein